MWRMNFLILVVIVTQDCYIIDNEGYKVNLDKIYDVLYVSELKAWTSIK
jgi:hypothetical protein